LRELSSREMTAGKRLSYPNIAVQHSRFKMTDQAWWPIVLVAKEDEQWRLNMPPRG